MQVLKLSSLDLLAIIYFMIDERKDEYMKYGIRLYQAALKGDWEVAKGIFQEYRDIITAAITKRGDTALHIASVAMRTKFVQELVSLMSTDDLGIRNNVGNTALCLAAVSGDVPIAKAIVDMNPGLPRIRGHSNLTPLQMAAMLGHEAMVEYLLPRTAGLTNSDVMDLFTHIVNTDLYGMYPNLILIFICL